MIGTKSTKPQKVIVENKFQYNTTISIGVKSNWIKIMNLGTGRKILN